jgi:hypothetical protein
MIRRLMEQALGARVVVIGLALVLALAGFYSFTQLDIEAYPDPVQPMVEVLTLPNGLSAEEVERIVTVPLEFGLSGMLGLRAMRSISLFGLSDIRCYFDCATVAGGAGPHTCRRLIQRLRFQASTIRRGSAVRPTAGSRGSSAGSALASRNQSLDGRRPGGTSSASKRGNRFGASGSRSPAAR